MLAPVDREPDPSERAWQLAVQVAVLFAIDPVRLGGVRVRAPAGPLRDAWLALLASLLPGRSWKRMPAAITDERLLGGLDLPATLAAGRPILQQGLLAEADGGLLVIAMAERLPDATAARIAQAMDTGSVTLQRDGLGERRAARFGVVALDEGMAEDEALPASLCDRFAFTLDLRAVSPRVVLDEQLQQLATGSGSELDAARETLPVIALPSPLLEALCSTALALGIDSIRAALLAVAAARASAALDGNHEATEDDIRIAAALVLAPRATRLPSPASDTDTPAAEQPEAQASEAGANADDDLADPPQEPPPPGTRNEPQALEERVLDAATAALPAGLLAALLTGIAGRLAPQAMAGKSGVSQPSGARGRPAGSRRGMPGRGRRLHLIDTLRAAAPWQPLRKATQPQPATSARLLVRADDFHVVRTREKTASTTLFVVDASGSSALHRLAEAKGAVELLLADCYVRRDHVALIAFRGRSAELLLPPTRSLARARRSLCGLPGGGGTPLAAALDAAATLAEGLQRRGQSPLLVLLTDGRANVARDGSGGRERAQADAIESARRLALLRAPLLLIDTSPRPQREAAELAAALRARYLPLPHADAAVVSEQVRQASRLAH